MSNAEDILKRFADELLGLTDPKTGLIARMMGEIFTLGEDIDAIRDALIYTKDGAH